MPQLQDAETKSGAQAEWDSGTTSQVAHLDPAGSGGVSIPQSLSSDSLRKQLLAFPASSPQPVQHLLMLHWEATRGTDACARRTVHVELTN